MMNIRKQLITVFLIALLVLSAAGCAGKPPVDGAETVSAEQIREMIRQARESALAAETEEAPDTKDSPDTPVYWTDGGQVWHTDPACASLKRAKSVRTGTVEEAKNAGKSRICSYCESK